MTGCFPGISQSRISHWLLQHGSDLSEQKKRAFYRWYTLEKTTPGTLHLLTVLQTPPPASEFVEGECLEVDICVSRFIFSCSVKEKPKYLDRADRPPSSQLSNITFLPLK